MGEKDTMTKEAFADMLRSGKPNTRGRTEEVVALVEKQPDRMEELYQCYFDDNEWVRMRTSGSMKRVWRAHPDWVMPYIDRFLEDVCHIDQASAQWTMADCFRELAERLTPDQRKRAIEEVKIYLESSEDWIVLNSAMQTLAEYIVYDPKLANWLRPHLRRMIHDPRKSISKRAIRLLKEV